MAGQGATFDRQANIMKQLIGSYILFFLVDGAQAQSKLEKINVSYWYVFGRFPSAQEQAYWNSQPDQSVGWYITNHHNYLREDDASNSQAVHNPTRTLSVVNPMQVSATSGKNSSAQLIGVDAGTLIAAGGLN